MSQNDLVINNQSFPSFRTDLNSALQAIYTTHSGTSLPSGASAGTIWLDTTSATTPTLKYYDGTDNISLATIDHVGNTVNWLDSTVSITGLSTSATGTVLTLTDTHLNSTVSIRIPTAKGIDDDSGNEFLKFTKTASAVNEFTIINSATGSAPEIQSTGSDTNIDLKITPKGSGNIILDGIKFPNADGSASQVLQTNGSGVLSFATPSGGKVLQVVTSDENTPFSTSSTSFVNTNIEVSITPSSASNKIFIMATVNGATTSSSSAWVGTIFRNSTNLASGVGVLQESFSHLHVNTAGDLQIGTSLSFLDSPSTTSATTYSIRIASFTGNNIAVNGNSQHSTITCFEIKG